MALLKLTMLLVLHDGLRALVTAAWRELWATPRGALLLLVALKVGQALLSSLSWYHALRAAWPGAGVSYRFVVRVEQGQDVVNTVLPGRAGTWTMLGVVREANPGARVPTLLAVWGTHTLAFVLFAATSAVVVVGVPGRVEAQDGLLRRLVDRNSDLPLSSAAGRCGAGGGAGSGGAEAARGSRVWRTSCAPG